MPNVIADDLQQWYDAYGTDMSPAEAQAFVYDYFNANGYSPDEANFALQVMMGESGGDIRAAGDNGRSLGLWQLYDEGLRPDFMQWATQAGVNADPFDPISTTAYVAQFIRNTNGQGWSNWSAARNLGGTGNQAALDQASLAESAESIQTSQQARKIAELGLGVTLQELEENRRQGAFDRARMALELKQATDSLADARRRFAVDAMIAAAPYYAREGQYKPGFEPSGAASALGQTLGTNVPFQQMQTQKLPLNDLVNAPILGSGQAIDQQLGPLTGATPMVPGLRESLTSGMMGIPTQAPQFGGGGGGGGSTYQPATQPPASRYSFTRRPQGAPRSRTMADLVGGLF